MMPGAFKFEGGKDGNICENKKCGKRGSSFPICYRDQFNYFGLFHLWGFPMGSWSNRGGTYPYKYIWILTLKRIYAEGLQQGRRKKRIIIWRMRLTLRKFNYDLGNHTDDMFL